MSVSSSSTSGRRRVRNAGIPTRYWCGVGITDVISKSTLNASRRYYGVFMRLEGRYVRLALMLILSFKFSDKIFEQNVVAYGRQSRLQMGR